jgi:hypothetical protein
VRTGDKATRRSERRSAAFGSLEPDPAAVGVEYDFETSFVDYDVVMKPAENDQLFGVGPPTLGPRSQVVDLKSAVTVAPVG